MSDALLAAAGGRRVLARLLAMRGIVDSEQARRFLDPELYTPTPPEALHDLEKGADRIEQAIKNNEVILVWGDFDVDGQTSTSLLVSALEALGAQVKYHIPVRAEEGHGIQPAFLEKELDKGADVLLSCDTGIAAVAAVDLANQRGVEVIITDHHDLPATLPAALALINPKFHQEDHPLYALPGVGVAYKLIEALCQRAGRADELEAYLDLVAMGIVADIAQQVDDTRYLLQRGLEVLRRTQRTGLQAIMELGNVNAAQLIDENIGFQIGPRLNAVGRLGDANVSVSLLTTDDAARAKTIAEQLEQMNLDRRYKTSIVYGSAVDQLERDPSLLQYAALVLSNPEWHQGVIGIVASRLVEEYGKPTILLAAPEGEPARGSARSIEGYHITEAIASQADYLLGFGGHPMAAGMALEAKDIDRFRRGVSKAIIEQRTAGRIPVATLDISLEVKLQEVTPALAAEVELMAPFGAGNPPVNYLVRNVVVIEDKVFGKDLDHRKLLLSDGEAAPVEVLWWGGAGESLPEGELDVVFRMRPSWFRGEQGLQITLQDVQRADRLRKEKAGLPYEVVDLRLADAPMEILGDLKRQHNSLAIWGEVVPAIDDMKNRTHLGPADALVVWTMPPNRRVLQDVIAAVKPETVYFFSRDPRLHEPAVFLKRLVGLAKYTLEHYAGQTTLRDLAAACAQPEVTIAAGLAQLTRIGVFARVDDAGDVYLVRAAAQDPKDEDRRLIGLLKETNAFRRAFLNAGDLAAFLA